MVRTKALRPRKRVGNRFEEPLSAGSLAQFAAPLSTGMPGALFATNVSGPSTPFPASYNTFSIGGDHGSSGGVLPVEAPPSTATASSRPAPSLPFASLELPRSRDATNSSSSSSSVASGNSEAYISRLAGDGDAAAVDWRGNHGEDQDSSDRESDSSEEMITISRLELERWQQKVIFQVEDHFSNEQLKRIAEFGRVHASLLVEAKQYVYNVERQLNMQLEQERASLRTQAEAFVSKVSDENALLRARIQALEQENAALHGNTVEDEDTDMSPPSVPASDECDQENAPLLPSNAQRLGPSGDNLAERDTPGHHKKHASEHLAIKPREPLAPTAAHLKGPRPVTVTPTSVNQVPELEVVGASHEGSPSASGDDERRCQPIK